MLWPGQLRISPSPCVSARPAFAPAGPPLQRVSCSPVSRAYLLESHEGSLDIPNHRDTQVDALIEQLRLATDREEFLKVSHAL